MIGKPETIRGISNYYFTVYLSDNLFATYLHEEYFGAGFACCVFGKLTGMSFLTVNIVDVGSAGVGANVDFGPVSLTATFPVGTKEEQAQGLIAFKARGLALPK